MTPQEKEMIGGLIDRVQKTQLPDKDIEAEQYLQGGLGSNRDSLYILSQTVLVQQYALDQAARQLEDLKAQLEEARRQPVPEPKHTSFLGSIFGSNDADRQPPSQAPRGSQQNSYAPVPNYAPPPPSTAGYGQVSGYGQPVGYPPQAGGFGQPGGGGFLRGAMQTAAGVAAGALAFQGVESLLHGFGGHESGGFGGFGGGGENGRPEVINNYYGDSDRGSDSRGFSDDNSQSALATEAGNNDLNSDRFGGSGNDASDRFAGDSSDLAASDDSASLDDNLDDGGDSFSDGGDSFSDDSFGGGDDSSFT